MNSKTNKIKLTAVLGTALITLATVGAHNADASTPIATRMHNRKFLKRFELVYFCGIT